MFTHSTTYLRGCLHRKSVTPGHWGPRREPSLYRCHRVNLSSIQQHEYDPNTSITRPTHLDDTPTILSPARPPQERVINGDPTISTEPPGSLRNITEGSPPIESRVASAHSLSGTGRSWSSGDRERSDLSSVMTKIFGNEITLFEKPSRPPLSARLEARKLPGPRAVSELRPVALSRSVSSPHRSPQWSLPGWRTVTLESDLPLRLQLDEFNRIWVPQFSKLRDLSKRRDAKEVARSFKAYTQVAISVVGDRNLDEMRKAWVELPPRQQLQLASVLVGCLADSARRTLLLLSLDLGPAFGWHRRCQCLGYLDTVRAEEIAADPSLQEQFAQQIEQVSRIWTWPIKFPMPWYILVLLLRHNTPEHCENMIDTILEHGQGLDSRSILVMVDHLTQLGDVDRALGLLSRIPAEQREEHKVRILERCANLVSIDTIEKSDSAGNFRALPKIIGLGLPMDGRVHNRILARALDLGVPDVAWEVFHFMEARDILVDAHSHLLLLKDSFERNNREKLDAMMSAIHGRLDLYQYTYLVTYMMHIVRVVCTIDRNLAPEKSVSHLLAVYDRAYKRAPLIKLGIVDALPLEQTSQKHLQEPPPAVLGFTLWAYVLCQRDERLVSALWFWIIHMIKQQDEDVLACAKHDIMWNGFIHFYARNRSFLRKAVDVVEAMIEQNLCMPTERTWSEVLCGFMKHGEEETAAKIWQMMLARNVHPTKKGWAFLLENYDETQLAELVKRVLDERRMPQLSTAALDLPIHGSAFAMPEPSLHGSDFATREPSPHSSCFATPERPREQQLSLAT